ncbi:MAG: hypothetical protein M1339_04155 [Bacteroidetes bacterium]|nr:hypothetical protein [Bacteroidota bacterium]
MKRKDERAGLSCLLIAILIAATTFPGCNCNPIGPGSYKDSTKFTWTVDTVYDPSNCRR